MWRPRSRSCASARAGAALVVLATLGAVPARATWLPEVPITTAGIETEIGLNHTPLIYDPEGGLTVAWAQRDTPQQNFQIYADGGRIQKLNAQGERELMSDEEIEAKRASSRREMDEACKKS